MKASYNFELVMSLLAMSLGLSSSASRKGRQGEVGGFQHLGEIYACSMPVSGLSCRIRKPLVGTGWAISLLL